MNDNPSSKTVTERLASVVQDLCALIGTEKETYLRNRPDLARSMDAAYAVGKYDGRHEAFDEVATVLVRVTGNGPSNKE